MFRVIVLFRSRSELYLNSGSPLGFGGRWVVALLAAFVFLSPNVDFPPHLSWHDGQRLAQLAVLALALPWMLMPCGGRLVVREWLVWPTVIRGALVIAFMLGLVSATQAEQPRWALLEWGLLLLLLLTVPAIAAGRRGLDERADKMLILLFFATATAHTVTACTLYVAMFVVGYGPGFEVRELYSGFSNIRFFGAVQTLLLPFLLLPAMYWGSTAQKRLLWFIVPALWWMLAVASGTRGTWAALLSGTLIAAVAAGRSGRHWAKWQLGGLLCGVVCYIIFIRVLPQLVDLPVSFMHRQGDILGLSRREVIWSAAWQHALEHPWLGIGPMHFAAFVNEVAAHPHNALLQWMAEWGVPATLLFASVWAWSGLAFMCRVRVEAGTKGIEKGALFSAALLAALAGASVQAMVDGVFVMPVSQMLCVLLAGWALGMTVSTSAPVLSRWWWLKGPLPAVFLAAAAIVNGVALEIGDLESWHEAYLQGRGPDMVLRPRFWAQGWISH